MTVSIVKSGTGKVGDVWRTVLVCSSLPSSFQLCHMSTNSIQLSDQKAAQFLQNTVDELKAGDKSRKELRDELLAVLFLEDPVISKDGPLRSQGRLAFGNDLSYRNGVGLFVPDNALPTGGAEAPQDGDEQ